MDVVSNPVFMVGDHEDSTPEILGAGTPENKKQGRHRQTVRKCLVLNVYHNSLV